MSTPIHFLRGSDLSAEDQKHVLARFVHRFTREHIPTWTQRPDCAKCAVQFASDTEWLANTVFAVTKSGRVHRGDYDCQSSPTWPDNPELRTTH